MQSVTDSNGNSYKLAVGPTVSTGNGTQSIYYAPNIAPAAANVNTVTVIFNTEVCYPDVRIAEYSGIAPGNPVDVAAGTTADSAVMTSGSVTTTNANDLLVGANYVGGVTVGPGPAYAPRIYTDFLDILEDQIVSATGSYAATAPQADTDWWIMQLVAFRAASGSGGGDNQPPTTPTGLVATATTTGGIYLSWTASTDNVAVSGYVLQRCQGSGCTSFTLRGTPTGASYSSDSQLPTSTSYSYRLQAVDGAGNLSGYSTAASATTVSHPAPSPSTPTGLTATAASPTEIHLNWTASTGTVEVTGYNVQRCQGSGCTSFSQVGTATGTSYSDTGLSNSTSYTYRVQAVDGAGNLSGYSSVASTITLNDTQPPSAPTALTGNSASNSQINLSWVASTDNVGVTGYLIERCSGGGCTNFAQVGTATATSYIDTGLTASTSYSYRVRATDAAGSLSAYSTMASAATSAAGAICD